MQFDQSSSFFFQIRPTYFHHKTFQTPSDCVCSFETSAVTKLAVKRNKPGDQTLHPKGVENSIPAF
jgi:hypothetical protein